MDRGYFRALAAYTLIALMIASPVTAATPGDASRRAIKATKAQRTVQSSSKNVQNAVGTVPPNDGSQIRQVVGKQPGKRTIDPNRTLSLFPSVLSGSNSSTSRSSTSRSSSSRSSTPRSTQTPRINGGLLGGLFGSSNQRRTATAAPPADVEREPVDWQGIPYHQARSKGTKTQGRSPIRDPRPGETRIASTKTPPKLATTKPPAISKVPTPPKLAPAPSTRRVVTTKSTPATTVSSRLKRTETPELSALSSSRRSGRRDLPKLDASEIAAANASKLSEEELVPKVSRRRLQPEPKAIAKVAPKKPATTPAADMPATKVVKATPKPAATTVAKVEAKPAPAPKPPAKVTEPAPTQVAQAPAPATTPAVSTPVAVAPAKAPAKPSIDNFTSTKAMTPQVYPPQVAATNPTPTGPQFVAPRVMPAPRHALPPAAPQFSGQGSVVGHRAASPEAMFQPRGYQGMPAASAPVGSGIANREMPQGSYSPYAATPQIATQPAPVPPAQPVYPRDPYANQARPAAPATTAPITNPAPLATLGQPSAAAPPLPPPAAPAPKAEPKTQTVASPANDAFRRTPFSEAPAKREASAPKVSSLAANQTAVASELPGIRVVTHGPSSVTIRQNYEFEVRVENRGSIDAAGVMVRTVIPDWAEVRGQNTSKGEVESQMRETSDRLVWTIESLPAGTSESMFVRLQAVRSGTHGMDVDWTLIPQKSVATIEVREPKLDLLIEGPEEVVYGESQAYKVRVLNPGDGIAPNVVFTLSPNSATPQTQRIGDIPSGKEAQFEVELTAQDLGDLKIHGLAMGDLELKAEANKTIRVSAAELESVLTGPEMKYQDTDAVYHLELTNNGTTTSENVEAVLTLPSGVEYLGGISSAKLRGKTLAWKVESIAPGTSQEFNFECAMKSPGKQSFEFKATGSAAGDTSVALDTQVDSIADLVMTIQDPTAPAPVGSEVTYEIVIKNRGSREAKAIRAIAQFSHGIEPRRVEGHTGQVLTGQVLFDPIDTIQAGGEVRIRVFAEAEAAGHHRFRTEIRSGETVLVAEEATHYMNRRSDRVSRHSSSSSLR